MNIYYAIIAAGGKAKRFLPYSLVMPKELLPIDGVPAIQYSIEECIGAGINRIIIVTRPGNDLIYQYLLKNEKYSQYLVDTFCDQEQTQILILPEDRNLPYGNAAPLLTAKDIIIGNKFLVLFADDISVIRYLANEYVVADVQLIDEPNPFIGKCRVIGK